MPDSDKVSWRKINEEVWGAEKLPGGKSIRLGSAGTGENLKHSHGTPSFP